MNKIITYFLIILVQWMWVPDCSGTDPNVPPVDFEQFIPDPNHTHTLFLYHFDADWGRGRTEVLSEGGAISVTAKYGPAAGILRVFPLFPKRNINYDIVIQGTGDAPILCGEVPPQLGQA